MACVAGHLRRGVGHVLSFPDGRTSVTMPASIGANPARASSELVPPPSRRATVRDPTTQSREARDGCRGAPSWALIARRAARARAGPGGSGGGGRSRAHDGPRVVDTQGSSVGQAESAEHALASGHVVDDVEEAAYLGGGRPVTRCGAGKRGASGSARGRSRRGRERSACNGTTNLLSEGSRSAGGGGVPADAQDWRLVGPVAAGAVGGRADRAGAYNPLARTSGRRALEPGARRLLCQKR